MSDTWDAETRSRVMSRIRGKNTRPEMILRSALHRSGLRFRLHSPDLPGRPDLVFRRARVAVFVHGCFWHGCPAHYQAPKTHAGFWRNKLNDTQKRDVEKRRQLERAGWKVVELWEHAVEDDLESCVAEISCTLNQRLEGGS